MGQPEDGRGKCSFDPSQSFTTVMVGELTPVFFFFVFFAKNHFGRQPCSKSIIILSNLFFGQGCKIDSFFFYFLVFYQMESCTLGQLITF